MAIRIRFPAEEPPPVELTSYQLTELALSLHAVADPRQHAALAPFVRRARSRLPKSALRELGELSLLLGPPAPASFIFPEADDGADVPHTLQALSPNDEELQWTLTMLVEGYEPRRLHRRHENYMRIVADLQRDPEEVTARLIQLLRDYWTYAFAPEWPGLQARLQLARAEAELQLASGGLATLLAHTTRRVRLSGCGIAVTPSIPTELDVALADDGRLPIVLTLFSGPYVITRIAPAAGLVLPAPAADRRVTAPSLELVQGLDAIADPTRLTLLRLVAARPRSTRELSQLLDLSEAAVSKHLRRLADADLVLGQRSGYYVLYRLVPERATSAAQALLEFLRVASDSPPG